MCDMSVANSGSSSITTGSPPVTVKLWMRASGLRPCSLSAFSLTTSTALNPSQIWQALAAEITPPSCSSLTEKNPTKNTTKQKPTTTKKQNTPTSVSTI